MLLVLLILVLLSQCNSYHYQHKHQYQQCQHSRMLSTRSNKGKYKNMNTYMIMQSNNDDSSMSKDTITTTSTDNNNDNSNIYVVTKNGQYKNTTVYIDRMNILDLHHVVELSTNQFRNRCKDEYEVMMLKFECLMLFLPKLLFPQIMKHSLISIRASYNYNNNINSDNNNVIIGFVDVSLQPCDGTFKSLRNLPLFIRKMMYDNNISLQPYLCNLLVRPEFRSLGLGKLLISECEKEAKLWGYNKLHLHVEKQSAAVLGLYLNMKFDPIKDNSNIIFMAKELS